MRVRERRIQSEVRSVLVLKKEIERYEDKIIRENTIESERA